MPLRLYHASTPRHHSGSILATIEVRVWQDVRDAESIYVSARPAGGSWDDLGTIPLPLDDGLSSSGNF